MNRPCFPAGLVLLVLAGCGDSDPSAQRQANGLAEANAPAATPDKVRSQQPTEVAAEAPEPTDDAKAEEPISACLIQDGERIPENRLKGLGTEPFWAVRIEGRCVTYITPEDPDGTRVWTQFTGSAGNGTWSGYLDEQRFVLRTEPKPGCSDGMSDNRYPIAVTLAVHGEERAGCAEPL